MADILTRHFAINAAAAPVEVFLSEVRWLDRRTFNTACNELKWSFNVHLYEEPSHSVTVAKIVTYCKILFQHYHNQHKVGETLCLKHNFTILNQSSVYCRRIVVIQGRARKHLARVTGAVITQNVSFENLIRRQILRHRRLLEDHSNKLGNFRRV
jgi:hypothetical protein